MFGYVTVNTRDLEEAQKQRYTAVYCGICRQICRRCSNLARVTLSYDTAFLAMLLMSLYEPEEKFGQSGCLMHPIRQGPWVENEYIAYAADMNVALAFHNCQDDWQDDKSVPKLLLATALRSHYERIRLRYPRQCQAMETCMTELGKLEAAGEQNPDLPAGVFGVLMAELLVYREDLWSETLRSMGNALGRFIYLMDGAEDYDSDVKKKKYNPFAASGQGKQPELWRQYLEMTMSRCTAAYEKLPLVQDKAILDAILYSGVWTKMKKRRREGEKNNDT